MNKDLMMKAAIQFKGVWPDDNAIAIGSCVEQHGGHEVGDVIELYKHYNPECWEELCTREQFEDFVESLFEGAPDGTTHYSPEDKSNHQSWWKLVGDEMLCICEAGGIYTWERDHFGKNFQPIPRPAKKAEPVPCMPKVGEECECKCTAKGKETDWIICCPKYISKFTVVVTSDNFAGEFIVHPDTMQFRPLRTERERLIDALVNRMINHYGNPKGAEGYKGLAEAIADDDAIKLQS